MKERKLRAITLQRAMDKNPVSINIAPTWDCTHFLKIELMITGGRFYSYYIHKGNKLDKKRKIVRKNKSFIHTKIFKTFF